jgi:hypothetical protein
MFEMIPQTPGFSAEVYHWAAEVKEKAFPGATLIFREWWKANEASFKKKDYLGVKRGVLEVPSDTHGNSAAPARSPNVSSSPSALEYGKLSVKAPDPVYSLTRLRLRDIIAITLAALLVVVAFVRARRRK